MDKLSWLREVGVMFGVVIPPPPPPRPLPHPSANSLFSFKNKSWPSHPPPKFIFKFNGPVMPMYIGTFIQQCFITRPSDPTGVGGCWDWTKNCRKVFFSRPAYHWSTYAHLIYNNGGFARVILKWVRWTISFRVLYLHRRSPLWTTPVLYSRVLSICNEPVFRLYMYYPRTYSSHYFRLQPKSERLER